MNMAKSTVSGVDMTLAIKCLDFCQALTGQGIPFNFTLNLGSCFNFSLDTRKKATSPEIVKKKLSPSSLRRNAKRKEEFLKKKSELVSKSCDNSEVETSIQGSETFNFDKCDYQDNCKVSMIKHVDKEHKVIPQIDGLEDTENIHLIESPQVVESEKEKIARQQRLELNMSEKEFNDWKQDLRVKITKELQDGKL